MRVATTRGTIKYEHDAEEMDQGFYFTLEYVFTPGDEPDLWAFEGRGYSGSPDDVSIVSARCTRITDELTDRKPEPREAEDVGKWFMGQIAADHDLRERIEDRIVERERGL